MDFNIKLNNGQVLTGTIHSPGENSKAVVILVHGLGEHINRYAHWFELFKANGIAFAGVDLPGHGGSDGRRGCVSGFSQLEEMIDVLITTCKKTFPGIPIFLYGHSLGGAIVLQYVLQRNPKIKGVILSSPWLKLSFEPSKSRLVLASIMRYLLPGLVQSSGLNVNHITHDEKENEKYRKDPLIHDKISVGLFYVVTSAARYSLENASQLKLPTLIFHGSDDQITSPEGSREVAEKTNMAQLKIWEGGYHELHNELFKEEVFLYLLNWLKGQLNK
jgi:acylglycerol lipase